MKKITLGVLAISILACSGTLQNAASGISDPTERGLMYVATAIVIHGICTIFS